MEKANIKQCLLTRYLKDTPDDTWAAVILEGMELINAHRHAEVTLTPDATVVISGNIGPCLMVFARNDMDLNPNRMDVSLIIPGLPGERVQSLAVSQFTPTAANVENFVFDSLIAIAEQTDISTTIPLGKGKFLSRTGNA